MPGSQGRTQISPTSPDRQRIVLVADDLNLRQAARLAGGSALGFRIVGREHGHREGLGHRIERGHLNAEAVGHLAIGFARQRDDHGLAHAMLAIARRRRRPQQDVGHRAQRIELGGAGRPDLVPEAAGRKTRRHRQRAIRPQRRIGRIPQRIAVEERQAGVEHVVGAIAEILRQRAADAMGLRMRADHALRRAGGSRRVHDVLRIACEHGGLVRLLRRCVGKAARSPQVAPQSASLVPAPPSVRNART